MSRDVTEDVKRVTATASKRMEDRTERDGEEGWVEEMDKIWEFEAEDAIVALQCCEAKEGARAVAAACVEGEVLVLDSETGEVIYELEGHKGGCLCLGVGKDPYKLASGGEDGRVKVWDLTTGRLLSSTECYDAGERRRGTIDMIATCSNTEQFAVSCGKEIWILCFEEGEASARLEVHPTPVTALSLSASLTVHAATEGKMHLYENVGKGKISFLETENTMNVVDVDPSGKWVVTGCLNKLVHVWNMDSGESFEIKGISSNVKVCAFDPTGQKLVCNSGTAALVWPFDGDGPAGRVPCFLQAHQGAIQVASWAPEDAGLIATGGEDGLVLVWDTKESRVTKMQDGTRGPDILPVVGVSELDDVVMTLQWTDPSHIVAAYESGAIVCWSL